MTSDGKVFWPVKTVVETSCHINLQEFPWDKQKCHLSVGSWFYNVNQVKVVAGGLSYLKDAETNTWKVNSIKDYVVSGTNATGETYSHLIFEVVMARKPLFYEINLIAPSCLLAGLSNLAYLLPINSGERVSLPVTLFLSVTMFLTSVTSYIPLTSDVMPLFSK